MKEETSYLPKMLLAAGFFSIFGFTQQSSFSWKNAPNCKIDRYIDHWPLIGPLLLFWPLIGHSPVCSYCLHTPGQPHTPGHRHSRPHQPRMGRPQSSTCPGPPHAQRSEMLTNKVQIKSQYNLLKMVSFITKWTKKCG